jgi:hypothetical protein
MQAKYEITPKQFEERIDRWIWLNIVAPYLSIVHTIKKFFKPHPLGKLDFLQELPIDLQKGIELAADYYQIAEYAMTPNSKIGNEELTPVEFRSRMLAAQVKLEKETHEVVRINEMLRQAWEKFEHAVSYIEQREMNGIDPVTANVNTLDYAMVKKWIAKERIRIEQLHARGAVYMDVIAELKTAYDTMLKFAPAAEKMLEIECALADVLYLNGKHEQPNPQTGKLISMWHKELPLLWANAEFDELEAKIEDMKKRSKILEGALRASTSIKPDEGKLPDEVLADLNRQFLEGSAND